MAWSKHNVGIDTSLEEDVAITGSLVVDTKIKLDGDTLTTATNIPLVLKTDKLILKPYTSSNPSDNILDVQDKDGVTVFSINPATSAVTLNGSFNAGSIGIAALDLDNIDIDGNIIKIDSVGRSDGSVDNRVQIEQLLVKIGSDQADLFSVQDSSGGNIINVDTTASPNLVSVDGLLSTGSRTNLGYGTNNAEVHVGASTKAYVGVGTQGDYSSYFNNDAAVVINTVALKGTGSNSLEVRQFNDAAYGSLIASTVQALSGFKLLGTGCIITGNGNDDIDFQTAGGSTIMRLETDTKMLGINTTIPAGTLHAVGANAGYFSNSAAQDCLVTIKGGSSNDAALIFKADGGTSSVDITKVYQEDGVGFHIKTNNSLVDSMTILSAGNVGIGNTAPESKLEVNGDIRIPNGNRLYFYEGSDYNYLDFSSGNLTLGYTADALKFDLNTSTTKAIEMLANSNFEIKGYNDKDIFITPQGTGKVGIGTASPSESLHVNGNIRGNSIYYTGYLRNSSNSDKLILFSDSDKTEIHASGDDGIIFKDNANGQKMVIADDGKVGIGIASPSVNLHVLRSENTEVARFESTSVTGSRITIVSDSDLYASAGERDGHLVLQDTNSRKVAIGFDQPDTLFHMSGADPYMTFTNTALEDSDGGRESKLIFEGTTVAGGSTYDSTQHHLANIVVSHSGSANDKKGKFNLFLNDGDDSNGSLQNVLEIDGSSKDVAILGSYKVAANEGLRGTGETLFIEHTRYVKITKTGTGVSNFVIDTTNSLLQHVGVQTQLKNLTEENTEGGRESKLTWHGEKADGTDHRLAEIKVSHSGTGDDKAGRFEILVNDGDDANNSLTQAMYIGNAATGDAVLSNFLGLSAGAAMPDYSVAMGHEALKLHAGAANSVAIGYKAMLSMSGGARNVAIGSNALKGETGGANNSDNVGVGYNCLEELDGGDYNVAIGSEAGNGITTGSNNIAIGYKALYVSGADSHNIAIGYESLTLAKTDDDANGYNLAIGNTSGKYLEEGEYNTFIGHNAGAGSDGFGGANRLDGDKNTAIGYNAGAAMTTTAQLNTFVGHDAAANNTTGYGNTVLGQAAGHTNLASPNNVYIGYQAAAKTRGSVGLNTVIGYKAMYNGGATHDNNVANNNVVIGANAMSSEAQDLTARYNAVLGVYAGANMVTSDESVVIGYQSGYNLLSGNENVLIGSYAGYSLTDNAETVCIGQRAGYNLITGAIKNTLIGYHAGELLGHADSDNNIALGHNALGGGNSTETGNTANNNIAIGVDAYGGSTVANFTASSGICIGHEAGKNITTGNSNVLIGKSAGDSITTGEHNIGIGTEALGVLGTGKYETAVGYYALSHVAGTNASGSLNAAFGYQAGKFVSSGRQNTFLGAYSGVGITGTRLTGNGNTGVGYYTLYKVQGAAANNAVFGKTAAQELTTGSGNTLLGTKAGENLVTGINNTIVGFHAETSATDVNYEIVIGSGVDASNAFTGGGQDTIRIGRAAEYMEGDLTTNTWAHGSDRRIKKDIKDNSLGLEFINRLRTVTYKKKSASEHPSYFESYDEKDTQGSNKKHYGFIAQEVKKAMQVVGEEEFNMWSEREDGMQQLSETSLITPLVKAIQELSKEMEELKRRLNE